MSDLPDISVVMSVYNNEDTVAAAMDSILAQEGVALEFIVIDDGSTDGSAALLDEYAQRDSRVHIHHQGNTGLTRALIRGCEMARAAWIVRQDADDISMPGRLRALYALAIRYPDAGLVASSARYIGPEGEELYTVICTEDNELARRQILDLRIGPPAHGCVMFSRAHYQSVGGYRACFYYGQDSDLWMRLAGVAPVAYDKDVYYFYRLSPGAISGGGRSIQKQFGELGQKCRRARREGRDESVYLEKAEVLSEALRSGRKFPTSRWSKARSNYFIGSLLERNSNKAARKYFAQSVRTHPLYFRAWLKLIRYARTA